MATIPTIPTAAEIKARITADLNNKLNQATPDIAKAFNKVLAGALAGLITLLYQAILWTYKQIFPSTADITSLTLLGSLVNIFQLKASFAVLTADVSGDNGYIPPEGTQFRSSANVVYVITSTNTITGGIASVELTAQQSGDIGNLINGSILDIVNPDPQLIGTATTTATTISGDDPESIDSFRSRVISEYRKRRTGGAPADYEAWGLETPNFDWISPLDDPNDVGEVIVYGRVDNQTDGIPTGAQLIELYSYLTVDPKTGLRTRHPIGPDVQTLPISRFLFDIEIFIQNTSPSLESSIISAVTNYLETQEPYNEAINTIKKDTISEGGIADVSNDIANLQSSTITKVILSQTSPPLIVPSYQLFGGEFGKVNSITFTPVI